MLKSQKICLKTYFLTFKYLYIVIKKIIMEDKKLKRKITISINKDVLKNIENLTTNKSRLIEYILLDYLHKSNIKTNDIIL